MGLPVDELVAAIRNDADMDIALPDGTWLTEAQLQQRDNVKYNEGKDAGEEMAVKAVKAELNIDFTGKRVRGLAEHLVRMKPAEGEVERGLRRSLETAEQERQALETRILDMKIESQVFGAIPQMKNGLTASDAYHVMRANGVEFREVDGRIKMYKDDKPVTDARTYAELPLGDAIRNFWEAKGTAAAQPGESRLGRGGSNQPPSGAAVVTRVSDFRSDWVGRYGQGSDMGVEYSTALQKEMTLAREKGVELVMD